MVSEYCRVGEGMLDKSIIAANICDQKIKIDLFKTIGSTSEYLKGVSPGAMPHICIAEQQTKGQGRLGRSWHSPFAQNIYLSCRYAFQKDLSQLAGLSLAVAIAVIDALKSFCSLEKLMVKWPNDIICQDKKLGGILIDVQAEANGACSAIIGVGINVNMLEDERHQITQDWVSFRKILGEQVDRNKICISLINHLLSCLEQFANNGFHRFIDAWANLDYLVGREVALKTPEGEMIGTAQGIDGLGNLLLELSGGAVRAFSSGDTSIIKNA